MKYERSVFANTVLLQRDIGNMRLWGEWHAKGMKRPMPDMLAAGQATESGKGDH